MEAPALDFGPEQTELAHNTSLTSQATITTLLLAVCLLMKAFPKRTLVLQVSEGGRHGIGSGGLDKYLALQKALLSVPPLISSEREEAARHKQSKEHERSTTGPKHKQLLDSLLPWGTRAENSSCSAGNLLTRLCKHGSPCMSSVPPEPPFNPVAAYGEVCSLA